MVKKKLVIIFVLLVTLISVCFLICSKVKKKNLNVSFNKNEIVTSLPDTNFHEIIGYTDDKVYLCNTEECFEFIEYEPSSSDQKILYQMNFVPDIFVRSCYDRYIGVIYPDKQFTTKNVLVYGETEPIVLVDSDINLRFDSYITDNYVFYVEPDKSSSGYLLRLIIYNITTGEKKIISSVEQFIYEDGTMGGFSFCGVSGNDKEVFYQILDLSGGSYGNATGDIYRYNIETGKIVKMPKTDYRAQYVTGLKDYVVISEYCSEEPLEESGKLINKKKPDEIITIPNVSAVKSIKNSHAYGDILLFDNGKELFYLNTLNGECEIYYTLDASERRVSYNEKGVVIARNSNGLISIINLEIILE